MGRMHRKPKAKAALCSCGHPRHPKGICTATRSTFGRSTRPWQCGCAAGLVHHIAGKPHYLPKDKHA